MIGLPRAHISRKRSASRPRPSCAAAAPALSAIPPRSAPAQNALSPAPVSTTTRTASSALAAAIASRSPCITPYDIELRRSGRLIVTRATTPSTSYNTSLLIRASLRGPPASPRVDLPLPCPGDRVRGRDRRHDRDRPPHERQHHPPGRRAVPTRVVARRRA